MVSQQTTEFQNLTEIKDSIDDIPVQDPPEEFSATDLIWTKFRANEHTVEDVALIPYSKVDSFIDGECLNVESPTRFHIERGRKRPRGSLKKYKSDEYLLYRLYWCSFGPENHGEGGTLLPSRKYRLNTRNRAARPQSMRGCTCHFAVKRLYARPSVAMIIYHQRRHINKSGFVCHGPLDKDAIGPGARKVTYVGNEIQQQTMSLIYLGIPTEDVLQTHIEGVQRYWGPNADINASNYVQKLQTIIKRSTHELDLDDPSSVRLWVERNKKSVFFYQEWSDSEPFILGIQTEWQLQQMVRFSHQSFLATDSSFGMKKLKCPFYTLLVFDSRLHPLPVAWIITLSMDKKDVTKWLKALVSRAHTTDPSWAISGFIIDDPATEVDPIREVFHCPILFCLWRLRRSWLKNILKRTTGLEVQREMFKRLGKIVQSIWSLTDFTEIVEEFIQDYIDQTSFIEYFKECWKPKIEMWLSAVKDFPLASLESCGAIEAYHVKLKMKLYEDCHLDSLLRVDWLVHRLITEIHSNYWLDRYADETGSFQSVKEEYISSTSWQRALQIPDDAVSFDGKDHLFAKIVSQKDSNQAHVIWNPGSEFAFCDCSWSMQANLCKHVIKAMMMCRENEDYGPSISNLSYKRMLENLWKKPIDDSIGLDQSMAWVNQLYTNIQRLVSLYNSSDIRHVVSDMPVKWVHKKARTHVGRPAVGALSLPVSRKNAHRISGKKKNRKRKRMSRLIGLV